MATSKQPVVKHFFEFPDIEIKASTKFKAVCKECHKEVAGYGKTTSDFIKHMEVRNQYTSILVALDNCGRLCGSYLK